MPNQKKKKKKGNSWKESQLQSAVCIRKPGLGKGSRIQEKDQAIHLLFPFCSLQLHSWALSEADEQTQTSHS